MWRLKPPVNEERRNATQAGNSSKSMRCLKQLRLRNELKQMAE